MPGAIPLSEQRSLSPAPLDITSGEKWLNASLPDAQEFAKPWPSLRDRPLLLVGHGRALWQKFLLQLVRGES